MKEGDEDVARVVSHPRLEKDMDILFRKKYAQNVKSRNKKKKNVYISSSRRVKSLLADELPHSEGTKITVSAGLVSGTRLGDVLATR